MDLKINDNFSYDAILRRMLLAYEDLAESNGQDGDAELYEQQMKYVEAFRDGLEKFKENYKVYDLTGMSFLPKFFQILKTDYGCDLDELKLYIINVYKDIVLHEQEQLEKELSYIEVFKDVLDMKLTYLQ